MNSTKLNMSFLLILLCLISCMRPNEKQPTTIPDLLQRNASIGTNEERQWVNQSYTDLQNQIKAHPKSIKARLDLARLFMMEARATGEHGHYYTAALNVLTQAAGHHPNPSQEFEILALKASVYLSLHQFEPAKNLALKAVALNPHNAQIHGALVDAYVELGDYESAVTMADKMVSIRPDLRSYSRISYLREIHGQSEGAIEAMKMAISAGYPGSEDWAWSMLTLGQLYENYGSADEAEMTYQAILQQRENYPFAIGALAKLAWKSKNYEEAEKLWKEAESIIPEVSFYADRARMYREMGQEEAAQTLSKEVLEMLEDDEIHGHNMGMAFCEVYMDLLDAPEKALQYAQKEYDSRPDNIDVNVLMAKVYKRLGAEKTAQNYIETAIRTGSQHPDIKQFSTEQLNQMSGL